MATLDGVAADLQASTDRLGEAEAEATASGEVLNPVLALVAAVGLRGSAATTAALQQEISAYAAAIAQTRARGEELRARVLAIGRRKATGGGPPRGAVPTAKATSDVNPDHETHARDVDDILVGAGINPKDVYGDDRADSPRRISLATSLLTNRFKERIRSQMQGWALRFAAQAPRGDAASFARRYEYAKATFDAGKRELRKQLRNREIQLPAGQSADDAAATWALARDLDAQFGADSRVVQRLTSRPVVVDPHAALGDQAAAVQQAADRVGFTDTMAAAYHARKHNHELPAGESTDDVVTGYHRSARSTIGDGICAAKEHTAGSARLVFRRTSTGSDGRETTVRAVVYVRPGGHAVLATYGRGKGA